MGLSLCPQSFVALTISIRKSGNFRNECRLIIGCFTMALLFCCPFLPCPESQGLAPVRFSQNAASDCFLYHAVRLDPAASFLLLPLSSPLHIIVLDRLFFCIPVLILVFPCNRRLPIALFLACPLIVGLTILWHKTTSCCYYPHMSISYSALSALAYFCHAPYPAFVIHIEADSKRT